MSATQHIHRLILIVPAARCAALNSWIRTNLDPTGADWFTANLSASGNAPATHAWASFAHIDAEGKKLLMRLAQQSGLSQPADWDQKTRAQTKTWLLSNRTTVKNGIGVWIEPGENDAAGGWPDPQTVLTVNGLKVIQPEMPT